MAEATYGVKRNITKAYWTFEKLNIEIGSKIIVDKEKDTFYIVKKVQHYNFLLFHRVKLIVDYYWNCL